MFTRLLFVSYCLIMFTGCKQECSVSCGSDITLTAVGYTFHELDTLIIEFYTPDNTFSHLAKTEVITKYNPSPFNTPAWSNPLVSSTDTTSDTLAYTGA